jgi:hypothetical protein
MMHALRYHCDPQADLPSSPQAQINVAICWDADRLCRYRLHETPSNAYLTTAQARGRAAHLYASRSCTQLRKASWANILDYPGGLVRLGA